MAWKNAMPSEKRKDADSDGIENFVWINSFVQVEHEIPQLRIRSLFAVIRTRVLLCYEYRKRENAVTDICGYAVYDDGG